MEDLGTTLVLVGCLLFLLPNLVAAHDPAPLKWSQLPNITDPAATATTKTIRPNRLFHMTVPLEKSDCAPCGLDYRICALRNDRTKRALGLGPDGILLSGSFRRL